LEDELWLPAWRLRELVVEGTISPRELIQATLDRIARVDPWLHSFITVAGDRAMARARDLEGVLASGATPGPLFGVPISHKDEV
jgi:Asp-tRNA(Asn)/Glu-tRNA(Gln) amidotransferase A subunit family amidase